MKKRQLNAPLFHTESRTWLEKIAPIPRDRSRWPQSWKEIIFKKYERAESVPLPQPRPVAASLTDVLHRRHSKRTFSNKPVALDTLASLLVHGAGIRNLPEDETDDAWSQTRRTYPSGGARYPLEVYLIAERTTDLPKGVYHFNVQTNALEKIMNDAHAEKVRTSLPTGWTREAPVVLTLTHTWERNAQKYGDFGYQLALMEAGHLMQNMQLLATALGLISCPTPALTGGALDHALDLTERGETVLSALGVGYDREPTTGA